MSAPTDIGDTAAKPIRELGQVPLLSLVVILLVCLNAFSFWQTMSTVNASSAYENERLQQMLEGYENQRKDNNQEVQDVRDACFAIIKDLTK